MQATSLQAPRALPVALAMVCAASAYLAPGCIGYDPAAQVSSPRSGQPIGGRVALVYSRRYSINLGGAEKVHSFDIRKYERIYGMLVGSCTVSPREVYVPGPVTRQQVLRVHTPEFLASLRSSAAVGRYLEVPALKVLPAKVSDAAIVDAFRHATGGTVLASRLALEFGIAVNLAGGYHHAKPDAGEGFCLFNDIAIAIRTLQAEGRIRRAAVVDLDVHQGNGTAVCFAGDDSVFTFSMHEGDIYPIPKETSDLDIELAAGTDDREFLGRLRPALVDVLDKARPDLVIYQAGCDTLEGDPLARLAMTREGIVQRDALVIDECAARGIPVVMLLGGGYSKGAWLVQYTSVLRLVEKYGRPRPLAPLAPREPAKKVKYPL